MTPLPPPSDREQAPPAPATQQAWESGLKRLTVVLCDPEKGRADRLLKTLTRDLSVVWADSIPTLTTYCQHHPPAAAALALAPAGPAAAEALRFLRGSAKKYPILCYTDTSALSLGTYCQPLAAGARQVLNEAAPDFPGELHAALTRLVREYQGHLTEQDRLVMRFAELGLVGQSAALREAFQRVERASHFSDLPVLILGETGTGKQRFAEAIHRLDPRRAGRPFVTVNCSTVSKTLAETELFGHVRGAFSGAGTDRLGLFRAAEGGTLLLDEVGELDPELQPKLLRVLQERRLLPVGSDYEHAVDVRLIAATNRPLEQMVAEGRFREDLYQRLNVFRLRIPPLRERPEDLEIQFRHFLDAHQGDARRVTGVNPQILEGLRLLPWEGNSRQLENLAREILANTEVGPTLQIEDLPLWVLEALADRVVGEPGAESTPGPVPAPGPRPDTVDEIVRRVCEQKLSLDKALAEYERQVLQLTLAQHGGNRTRTAAVLGLTPRSIFNKIKKYGLG